MMINKRLINTVKESKVYIVKTVLFQWIALIANIISVFSIGILLQEISQGIIEKAMILKVFAIVVSMIIVRYFCNIKSTRMSYYASSKVKTILREKVYKKLLDLGNTYSKHVSTSEVVQVSVEGIEQLEIYFGRYLPQFFYSLLAPITLFIVISFVDFKAALLLLLCVPLIPASIIAIQKFAKKLLSKYWSIYTGLGDSFLENVQGMTTLKIYEADEAKNIEMNEEAELFRKITMKVLTMQLNSVTLMDLIAFGGAALGVVIATLDYRAGHITLWQGFIIIMLAAEFFIPLRLLGSYFHIAMNGMAASDKLFRLLDAKNEEVKSNDNSSKVKDGLNFENVSFSYEEDRQVLKNINLHIPKGSFVSLVGKSGCGKSTIAALAMTFISNSKGSITCDGVELGNYTEKDYMKKITYLGHNSYIFKGTVKENLLVGNKNASDEQLLDVLKQVNLYDFIMSSGGLSMNVLEKAGNLSGGQAQRLALARALLHDSDYYIFDEATSNIDVESEKDIMNVLRNISKNKTILLITHRLAQVVDTDKVYVMNSGEVIEEGTHDELMNNNGVYKNMFLVQYELEQYSKEKEVCNE